MPRIARSVRPVDLEQRREEGGEEKSPYREGPEKLSWVDAFAHVSKSVLHGTMISIPSLSSMGGLWGTPLLIMFLAVVCTYAINILVTNAQKLCRNYGATSLCYPEVAELAILSRFPDRKGLALAAKIVVGLFLVVGIVMCICSSLIIAAVNIKRISFLTDSELDIAWWVVIVVVPCLLVACCMPNLMLVTPFSWLGTLMILMGTSIISLYFYWPMAKISQRKAFTKPVYWSFICSYVTYPMQSIMVILTIESEMQNPNLLVGWLSITTLVMTLVTIITIVFGFLGFLHLGRRATINLLFDLPSDNLKLALMGIFALGFCCQVILYFYSLIKAIQHSIELSVPEVLGRFYTIDIIRFIFLVLCLVLSISLLRHAVVFVVLGGVALCFLSLFFPPVIDLLVNHDDPGRFYWRFVLDALLIVLMPVVLTGSLFVVHIQEKDDITAAGFACDTFCVVGFEAIRLLKLT